MSYAEGELLHLESGVVRPTRKWYPDRNAKGESVDWVSKFRARRFREWQCSAKENGDKRREPLPHGQMLHDLLVERFNDTLDTHKLTNNLLVLASVDWLARNSLRGFQLQVFVTVDCSLEDVALFKEDECAQADVHYYRFECDLAAPGSIFKEPFPHVHTRAEDEPRFPFLAAPDDNPILSFLEFIYMNQEHEKWMRWARRICSVRGTLLDDLDEMETVHDAGCSIQDADALLGTSAVEKLDRIREALWEAKSTSFPWVLDRLAGHALTYWSHHLPARSKC